MLVLTRKSGEGIRIGDDIRIIVVDLKEGSVKLGISAPDGVKIHRDEIYQKIQEENKRAAEITIMDLNKVLGLWKESDKEK
ncbi:MAG: carbon storage regulator CsrA [Deltaproteobacteria bacterium]|nr:carbon storage regulator CsrA [Deltaproteobacteria bacterium]